MKQDELFGQIDLPRYDAEGRWVRRTEGYLPDAHLAMIDEIDKGEHLLRSLLRVANERRWRNGDVELHLPLITMVVSANEVLPDDLAPVWDRFLIRESVTYIAEADNFKAMLSGAGVPEQPTTIALAELQGASTLAVPAITVPDDILDVLFQIRSELRSRGVIASDRRWKDSVRLLQARTFLAAHSTDADLSGLRFVLWTRPEQEEAVAAAIIPYVNKGARELGKLLDGLHDLHEELDGLEGEARSHRTAAVADLAGKPSEFRNLWARPPTPGAI